MQWRRKAIVGLAIVTVQSCSDSPAAPLDKLTLSSAQAAAIVSKVNLIAGVSPELSWLSDSIDIVLRAGAEVKMMSVTVDGIVKSYYALGLIRQIVTTNSFSTFHLIAFDNASSPTDFVLANGYVANAGPVPPSSMTGTFNGGGAFAHLIRVSGTVITDWGARLGTAGFQLGTVLEQCPGSLITATISCSNANLVAQATITLARPDSNTADVHTASFASVTVPGVLLTFR